MLSSTSIERHSAILWKLWASEKHEPVGSILCFFVDLKDYTSEMEHAVPESFPFPYPAYQIQVDFMREFYETLSQGKMGIFESPTGTVRL